MADEGLLVERREISAQEVVASAEETVMVDLEEDMRAMLELSRHVCRVHKNSAPLIAVTMAIKNTEWISTLGVYEIESQSMGESGRQIGAACQTFEIFEGASVVFFLIACRANLARDSLRRLSSRGNETSATHDDFSTLFIANVRGRTCRTPLCSFHTAAARVCERK